ncbi:MAG: hypothetical protein N3G21_12330 [Candidatus Hydrogenedentes bacterium]|nr:hypothetical protein [Candidatus Hydrogenedentota bacterium]
MDNTMMIYYLFLYGGLGVIWILVFSVHTILLIGAVKELRWISGRISRLQLEGAVLMLIGTIGRCIVFDPVIGIDRLRSYEWSLWFGRGETGLYLVGVILFCLGFFLSRRPRPGLKPWDASIKRRVFITFIVALGLGILIWFYFKAPWFNTAWGWYRVIFGIALYPFALGYLRQERNPLAPPPETDPII